LQITFEYGIQRTLGLHDQLAGFAHGAEAGTISTFDALLGATVLQVKTWAVVLCLLGVRWAMSHVARSDLFGFWLRWLFPLSLVGLVLSIAYQRGIVRYALLEQARQGISLVVFLLVWPYRDRLFLLPSLALTDLLDFELGLALRVLIGVRAVMTVLAALDFGYQKLEYLKRLRMSKQEVRDEHKQAEGDPMVRARLRQIRAERARRRMMAAIPEADPDLTRSKNKLHLRSLDIPNLSSLPSGCVFHPRCTFWQQGLCDTKIPPLVDVGNGREVACHVVVQDIENGGDGITMFDEAIAEQNRARTTAAD